MITLITLAAMTVAGLLTWLLLRHGSQLLAAPRIESSTIWKSIEQHEHLASMVRSRVDPGRATGLALTLAGSVVVLGATGFGVLLFMVRGNVGFARFDLSLARFGARHATSLSTRLLNDFSQLGGAVVLVPLAVAVGLFALWRWRTFMVFGFLAICVGGQFAVADLIKFAVGRARPNIDQLTGFSGSSFPSGHATAAAATFAAFALIAGRRRSFGTKVMLDALAVAIAVGVGCTRVLLGVHWLTDVLAGLALGWAWFAICSIAFGGRMFRFGAPAAEAQQAAQVLADVSGETGADGRAPTAGASSRRSPPEVAPAGQRQQAPAGISQSLRGGLGSANLARRAAPPVLSGTPLADGPAAVRNRPGG